MTTNKYIIKRTPKNEKLIWDNKMQAGPTTGHSPSSWRCPLAFHHHQNLEKSPSWLAAVPKKTCCRDRPTGAKFSAPVRRWKGSRGLHSGLGWTSGAVAWLAGNGAWQHGEANCSLLGSASPRSRGAPTRPHTCRTTFDPQTLVYGVAPMSPCAELCWRLHQALWTHIWKPKTLKRKALFQKTTENQNKPKGFYPRMSGIIKKDCEFFRALLCASTCAVGYNLSRLRAEQRILVTGYKTMDWKNINRQKYNFYLTKELKKYTWN